MNSLRRILSTVVPALIRFFVREKADGTASKQCKGILLEDLCIESPLLMGGKGRYSIYLPAECDGSSIGRKYPVLYLLHGIGDSNLSWQRKGRITQIIDKAREDGVCGPFITVMPQGWNSFYVDGLDFFDGAPGHRWEEYFNSTLIPYIESHYPADGGCRMIAGNSMGGYGALRNGVLHPERYRLCYAMSPASEGIRWKAMIDNVPAVTELIGEGLDKALPATEICCGFLDPITLPAVLKTHRRLKRMGIGHGFHLGVGSHSYAFWRRECRNMLEAVGKVQNNRYI